MARSRIVNLTNLEQFTAVNLLSDAGAIPGPVQVPSCVQITLVWSLSSSKQVHNVCYGRYGGGFTPTSAIANSIFTALTSGAGWSGLAGFLAPPAGFTRVDLRDVNTTNNPIVSSTLAGIPGTGTGTPMPGEVAAVVTLRTAKTGQAFRGRVYVPCWGTSALGAADTIAAGAVTALQTWADSNLRTALNSNGLTWVLGLKARQAYTGITGRQHPARSATSEPITSQPVRDNHWDTQRRRGQR